jgi:hypothetical protein
MQPDTIETIINIKDTIGVTAVTIAPANEVACKMIGILSLFVIDLSMIILFYVVQSMLLHIFLRLHRPKFLHSQMYQ